MASIDLLIKTYGLYSCEFYNVRIKVETAKELLNKSKELAFEYSSYYNGQRYYARVYIYDPTKKTEFDKEKPPGFYFRTPESLFEEGGYGAIVEAVKETQKVELKRGVARKKKKFSRMLLTR
jgi:hypothetical protein